MKKKILTITTRILPIIIIILLLGYAFTQSNQKVDCTALKENFDNYIKNSYLPIIENPKSLCHGLYLNSNFSELTPKWAVGKLIAFNESKFTFEGILQNTTIPINLANKNPTQYKIDKHYKIDMNNICRNLFMMLDSRYPSPISKTFVNPEEINCK